MRLKLITAGLFALAACSQPAETGAQESPVSSDAGTWVEATLLPSGEIETRASGNGRADQPYQLGSISKYVCSLVALDLHQEGVLSLDDTVADLLPGYTGPAAGQIRLIHLLQNRSGLADDLVTAYQAGPETIDTTISTLAAANRYAASETAFAPGSEYDYVISNWVLVQAILEEAGGAPLPVLAQTRLFEPADMHDSMIFSGTLPGPDAVQPSEAAPPLPAFVGCAGGAGATADDVIRLMRYPHQSGHFSQQSLDLLTTIYSSGSAYALGGRIYQVSEDGETRLTWLSGSNGTFESFGAYDPEADTGFAIVTNEGNRDEVSARRDEWVEAQEY